MVSITVAHCRACCVFVFELEVFTLSDWFKMVTVVLIQSIQQIESIVCRSRLKSCAVMLQRGLAPRQQEWSLK